MSIDYGRLSNANRNVSTGIHYGVISSHTVGQAWYDFAEPDYGEPSCPECGNRAIDPSSPDANDSGEYSHNGGCADWQCDECRITFDAQDAFAEEPLGYSFIDDGYNLSDCLDSDIVILHSPYYTYADFCSPCVPGAGNLNSPDPDGPKTYCLGHDWFEDGKAPYPVYSVATGQLV